MVPVLLLLNVLQLRNDLAQSLALGCDTLNTLDDNWHLGGQAVYHDWVGDELEELADVHFVC